MDFRNKATNHAFLLLALLPIPKFIHPRKKICGVMEARLYHECLDIILKPLKIAAQFGVLMGDPLGNDRWCFTPPASFIVDTPESALIAGVGGKTSSITMATHKQFGDPFRHQPRTASTTLSSLQQLTAAVDPADIEAFEKESLKYRLNGIHLPFWRDWPLAEPSTFLTSEPLHHWHKAFWDHDAKWCIHALGGPEINFRFSVLHPRTGYQHFKEGISSLKQVTGRDHRDIQRFIVPVIAGAVSTGFLIAIRALLDFRYLAQAPVITDSTCTMIDNALRLFHQHKFSITSTGAQRGKNGPISHWEIPKLEFLQSVVPNIQANGAAIQWSADITEHAHISVVKDPARSGNNQAYEPQICRYLDRLDKLDNFDLATAMQSAGMDFREPVAFDNQDDSEDDEDRSNEAPILSSTSELLSQLLPCGYQASTSSKQNTDYFYRLDLMKRGLLNTMRFPPRTFKCADSVVIHLS